MAIARIAIPQAMLGNARREILLVDVRPEGQRALGHIRGDAHVPLERIATAGAELPQDRRLVFYCSCPAEELALDAARALLARRKDRLRGRPVTLSAMVRTQAVARGAYLWIGAENAQGRIQMLTPPGSNVMVGSSGWRMAVVSARIPPDAAKVLVGISLMTSGRVWLDDVRVMVPEEGGLPGFRVALKNAPGGAALT